MLKSVRKEGFVGAGLRERARAELADAAKALTRAILPLGFLWAFFISLGLYLAVSAGGVTHRQLFLQTPLSLPLVGSDLPLVAFFWIAPFLFVVLHAYVLLHLTLLAERTRHYLRLAEVAPKPDGRGRSDALLPSHVFVEYLLAPRDGSRLAVDAVVRFVVWFTMVFAPVALLLLMQVSFLPYQDAATAWVHRGLLLADIALVLVFWPKVTRAAPAVPAILGSRRPALLAGSAVAILFSWGIATFPGEAHHDNALSQSFQFAVWKASGRPFFFNEVNPVTGRHAGWFANALVLPDEQLVDVELVEAIASRDRDVPPAWGQRSLTQPRGRSFVEANFERADLRRADFRGANLDGARLEGANLQEAALTWARLRGARLVEAQLQRASLMFAQLQNASIRSARLEGASLDLAQLQGATLDFAELQGASLFGARLQGASLMWAQLSGARLEAAQLEGASLDLAQLRGTSLAFAQLHGASLDSAQLEGASLDFARLLGTSLRGARLDGASLRRAFVWRAIAPDLETLGDVRSDDVDWAHVDWVASPSGRTRKTVLDADRYSDLLAEALSGVEGEAARTRLLERMAVLDPAAPDPEGVAGGEFWKAVEERYDPVRHAGFLAEIACAEENAPHVAERLLREQGLIYAMGAEGEGGAARQILTRLQAGGCPGAVGISDHAGRLLRNQAGLPGHDGETPPR